MYIAGLNFAFTSTQGVEALVVLANADYLRHAFIQLKASAIHAEAKGGRVRAETMSTLLSRIISPIHGLAVFLPPALYAGALVLNGFEQPEWMSQYALPNEVMGITLDTTSRNALRSMACIASLGLKNVTESILHHLGEQWHGMGRRERPRVVMTGPYALVRHPLYATVLVQQTLWTLMFWSYTALIPLTITAVTFAIKMPIEEAIIQQDDKVRDEYQEYMKRVPARIIPYIW